MGFFHFQTMLFANNGRRYRKFAILSWNSFAAVCAWMQQSTAKKQIQFCIYQQLLYDHFKFEGFSFTRRSSKRPQKLWNSVDIFATICLVQTHMTLHGRVPITRAKVPWVWCTRTQLDDDQSSTNKHLLDLSHWQCVQKTKHVWHIMAQW